MAVRTVLKILLPFVIIAVVVAVGFEMPTTIPQPTVASVSGNIKLNVEVQYAVFDGSCDYANVTKPTSISSNDLTNLATNVTNSNATLIIAACSFVSFLLANEVISSSNSPFTNSASIAWAKIYEDFVKRLCHVVDSYGGTCTGGVKYNGQQYTVEPASIFLKLPLSIVAVSYVVSAQVKLSNQLPLTVEKIDANESGRSLIVGFDGTPCANDCSFPMTLTSGDYSASVAESTQPKQVALSISVESAEVWGFPFWSVRIGTIPKTISATLDTSLSNSTVSLR